MQKHNLRNKIPDNADPDLTALRRKSEYLRRLEGQSSRLATLDLFIGGALTITRAVDSHSLSTVGVLALATSAFYQITSVFAGVSRRRINIALKEAIRPPDRMQ